jgi:hypothetical protein
MSSVSYHCQENTDYSRTISNSQQQQLATMSDDDKKTGSSIYQIEKLSDTNYLSLAWQLIWILDLLEIVMEPKPVPPTSTSVLGEYGEVIAAWTIKTKNARSIIGFSITNSMIYIKGIDTSVKYGWHYQSVIIPRSKMTLLQIIRVHDNKYGG